MHETCYTIEFCILKNSKICMCVINVIQYVPLKSMLPVNSKSNQRRLYLHEIFMCYKVNACDAVI